MVRNTRTISAFISALLLVCTGCYRARSAHGTAAVPNAIRKGINIVLVVDRSGSLQASGSCAPLIAAATNFVSQFTPYVDKIGLVTFASSTYVNFPISTTFLTADPNIADMLHHIQCAGSTSSAQALWAGYQQLIALNEPDATNAIVFFTDGDPTGVTFDMPIANSSGCRDFTPGSPDGAGGYSMPSAGKGYIRGVYGTFFNRSQWYGLLNPNGIVGPDALQSITHGDLNVAPNSEGCAYFAIAPVNGGVPQAMLKTTDFLGVPTRDIYGNSANTSYQPVTLNKYGFIDIADDKNAQAAALNAADSAGANIRNGAVDPDSGRALKNVVIYSIGLLNAQFPPASSFLLRVSNHPRSSSFDPSKRVGEFMSIYAGAELSSAFTGVARRMRRMAESTRSF